MRNKLAKIPDPNKYFTCSGEEFEIQYEPLVERDGTITLAENGKINIKEYINSFRDSTDMAFIMKQIALGDTSVLSANVPMYGDFRNVPRDPAEVLQYRINAERYFYSLPADIRNKFDNSVTVFLREGQLESEYFFKSLGVLRENTESEVKEVNAQPSD